MRHPHVLVLVLALLGACGGSAEAPEASQTSTGGEEAVAEPMLPLEAYLSPRLDYVSLDLEEVRRHPLASAMLEDALVSLEESGEASKVEAADAVRRTSKVLVLGSVEEAMRAANRATGWIFARGDYAGFEATTAPPGRVEKRGEHTLVVREGDAPGDPVGDPGERLDAAIVARVDLGDAVRASLAGTPANATVSTAERLRLRIGLGDVISILARVEHADVESAQASLEELETMLRRVRPLLLIAPKPFRRLVDKLVLRREELAVVASLDLTEEDVRELGELAANAGLEALIEAGELEGASEEP